MDELKIVKGNQFAVLIKIKAFRYDGTEILDFDLENCHDLSMIVHVNKQNIVITKNHYSIYSKNELKLDFEGNILGDYLLEATGTYNDCKWRFFDKSPIFTVVNTNTEANIPKQSIISEDFYRIESVDINLYYASNENKIDYIGPDNYVYKWDEDLKLYVKSDIYVKGDPGDPGEKGNQGDPGDKGDKGDKGDNGLSAYQIAVEHGYEGTEEEWLDSIKDDTTAEVIQYIDSVGYLTRDSLKSILAEIMDEIDSEVDSNY